MPNSTPILGILAEIGEDSLFTYGNWSKEKIVKIQTSQYPSNSLSWVANIKNLKYEIYSTFKDVKKMSQSSWKNITKKQTIEYSNKSFHNEALKLKKLKLLISVK